MALMTYKGGIITVGSLLWDNHALRTSWRRKYLNLSVKKIQVQLNIRYGRQSISRNGAYTIVFCNHPATRPGRGYIIPLSKELNEAEKIIPLAKALAAAEKKEEINNQTLHWYWGTVALWIKPSRSDKEIEPLRKVWEEKYGHIDNSRFSIENENPVISKKGYLNIHYNPEMSRFDFLLATATVPKPRKILSPSEIAKKINCESKHSYFCMNRKNGIRTFQDDEIIEVLNHSCCK